MVVSEDGRPFVWKSDGLWVLHGSIEEDTQVWVRTSHEGVVDLYRYAKGRGAVSRFQASGQRYVVLGETEVTSFPGATDAPSPQPVLSTTSGIWLGAAQGIGTGALQRLGPGAEAWEPIAETAPSATGGDATVSAVVHPNGNVYALNGARLYELSADLSAPRLLFDCNTRELGTCGASARLAAPGLQLAADGTLAFAITHDETELYTYRPGDARLTKSARVRNPINEQTYFGTQGMVVDSRGNAYLLARTEQVGGECHVLVHHPGADLDTWSTIVVGLPRVMSLHIDGRDGVWLWDHSDEYSGMWKLIPKSVRCPRCVATGNEEP